MDTEKKKVLLDVSFGKRVAEEEGDDLVKYFVETNQWKRILNGEIDIIYGPKGSGKSAIYSLLDIKRDILESKNIYNIQAENPRGATIFKNIVEDPPTSENEFQGLWKLYFLSLVGGFLRERNISGQQAKRVVEELERAELIQPDRGTQLRKVIAYLRRIVKVESLEVQLNIDPVTGMIAGVGGKITLKDQDEVGKSKGLISVEELLGLADEALKNEEKTVWISLDRLDVAFSENHELEENALRALFKTYLDMSSLTNLRPKIFLRDDIWRRLAARGFQEASHITRSVTISWSENQLLNLVMRRVLQSDAVQDYYSIKQKDYLADFEKQRDLFYVIFPEQIEGGEKQSDTFDWILGRTGDASANAPRELIHLFNQAKEEQLRMYEIGEQEPPAKTLFSRQSIKAALPEVSKVRLEQTLYAEYPTLRPYIEKLSREKTEQTVTTLARIWSVEAPDARSVAESLVNIRFFVRKGSKENPKYWIPFLYRPALDMIQGTAVE